MSQLCFWWGAIRGAKNNVVSDGHQVQLCWQLWQRDFEQIQKKHLLSPTVDTMAIGKLKKMEKKRLEFETNIDILQSTGLWWGKDRGCSMGVTVSSKALNEFKPLRLGNIKKGCFWQHYWNSGEIHTTPLFLGKGTPKSYLVRSTIHLGILLARRKVVKFFLLSGCLENKNMMCCLSQESNSAASPCLWMLPVYE